MRGLRNLTLTLIFAGKYEDARALADQRFAGSSPH